MGWETTRLDDDWEQPVDARLCHTPTGASIEGNLGLKGILLKPDVPAESLSFLFDREGNLRSLMGPIFILEGTLPPEDAWVFVKTQFAPPEVHVWMVGLLKYVKKHYISDLEVSDEGQYWETGDIRILRERMAFLDRKMDELTARLSSARLGDVSRLSPDELAAKIEDLLLANDPDRPQADPPQ